jgi:hypothetical protein
LRQEQCAPNYFERRFVVWKKFLHSPFMRDVFVVREGLIKEGRSMRILTGISLAAFSGAAMIALSLSSASALTLSAPSLQQPFATAQVEKAARNHYGWHRGWRGGPRNCWINRWGHRVCNW